MKIKIVLFVAIIMSTINAFSQKQNDKPLYTFCGKSGDCTIKLDEFKKCKKELTPIDKNLKINSFTVSMLVVSGKDSTWVDYPNTGNVFDKKTNDEIEKFINEKRLTSKILIEAVEVSQGDKNWKTPGMVIKLK